MSWACGTVSREFSGIVENSRDIYSRQEGGVNMHATELKHAANLEEWKKRIMDCRAGGLTVREWYSRNAWSNLNWAKRSIILAAKPTGSEGCGNLFPRPSEFYPQSN